MSTTDDDDRLSALPDHLLLHILSFLFETKIRAATSVLSQRWRYLWTYYPSIYLRLGFGENNIGAVASCLSAFRAPSLRSLSLEIGFPEPENPNDHAEIIAGWLREASRLGVCNLYLLFLIDHESLGVGNEVVLTLCLFSEFRWDALTHLTISFGVFPDLQPGNIFCFPNLKRLQLNEVDIDNESLAVLLLCCPVLENLHLSTSETGKLSSVVISSNKAPRLHTLAVDFAFSSKPISLIIEAPGIIDLKFRGDLNRIYWKGSLCLKRASLRRGSSLERTKDGMLLLLAASNASRLRVNDLFCQFVIPKNYFGRSSEPIFKSLKYLRCDLPWITNFALHAVTTNLGECPLLETLMIYLDYCPRIGVLFDVLKSNGEKGSCLGERKVLKYMNEVLQIVQDNYEKDNFDLHASSGELANFLPHLKFFTMRNFFGSKNEMSMINLVLEMLLSWRCLVSLIFYLETLAKSRNFWLLFLELRLAFS